MDKKIFPKLIIMKPSFYLAKFGKPSYDFEAISI